MNKNIKNGFFILAMLLSTFQFYFSLLAETPPYLPSTWALQKIEIATQIGLLPTDYSNVSYTQDISRLDFCKLLVQTSQLMDIRMPALPEIPTFSDTTDLNAELAARLGFTGGTGPSIFSPDLPLTREMAAVMLSKLRMLLQSNTYESTYWHTWGNHYETGGIEVTTSGAFVYTPPVSNEYALKILSKCAQDYTHISSWSAAYMADVYTRGILQGTSRTSLSPQKNLTREQAALLVLNVLTYCDDTRLQSLGITECILPAPSSIYIAPTYYRGNVYFEWNDLPLADAYDVTLYKDGNSIYSQRIYDNFLDLRMTTLTYNPELKTSVITLVDNPLFSALFGSDKNAVDGHIEVIPVNRMGIPSIFSMKQAFHIDTWINRNEKIFGDPTKTAFANDAEARLHMTSIKVYVWKMTKSGEKIPATVTLTVNQNVAEDLKKVFDLIYNGSEKFPINGCGAYAFGNGRSEHSFGTAIDINPNENYFVTWEGVPKVGSFWQPGISPFSIPSGGDVVRAFNQVGWHWSPDMHWSNGADYMHFSLTGN